jgi:hypothetical protein
MKIPRRAIRALCVAVTLVTIQARASGLVKDGSFEKPVIADDTYQNFAEGSKIGAWTVIGDGGSVAIVSGSFTYAGYSFPASAGKQWLDLTGSNSNGAEGVQQTIKTVAGTSYRLRFRVGNVSGDGFGVMSTVNVLINGTLVLSATNKVDSMVLKYKTFTYSFTAAGPATTIAFINGDPSNDNNNALDAISIVEMQ